MNKNRKINKTIQKKRNKQRPNNSYSLALQALYSNHENSNITGFEPHKYVTLKYVDNYFLSSTTGAGTQQTMNLNSIFDPDRTGVGHQPYTYDTWATVYNRYRVLKTKYIVRFGSSSLPIHVLCVPVNGLLNSTITTAATFATAAENPHAHARVLGTSSPQITVQEIVSLNLLNGVTQTEYLADDRFEAQIGASPTEVMTLAIGTYNPNASTVTIAVTIELHFMVDLHDPISIAGS